MQILDLHGYILSCVSEAGSPTNRPGSDKTLGQGSFGPSTGGSDLQGNHLDKNFKKDEPHTWFALLLLRQGEPGTSQYLIKDVQVHVT